MWLWLAPLLCAATGLGLYMCTMLVEFLYHRKHQKHLAELEQHHDLLREAISQDHIAGQKEETPSHTLAVPLPPMETEDEPRQKAITPPMEQLQPEVGVGLEAGAPTEATRRKVSVQGPNMATRAVSTVGAHLVDCTPFRLHATCLDAIVDHIPRRSPPLDRCSGRSATSQWRRRDRWSSPTSSSHSTCRPSPSTFRPNSIPAPSMHACCRSTAVCRGCWCMLTLAGHCCRDGMFSDREGPTEINTRDDNGHVEHADAETGYLVGTGLSRRSRIPEGQGGNTYMEVWRA